jgi:phosphate transport system permease protein
MKRAKSQTIFLRSIVYISAVITLMAVAGILIYILIKGVPHISWDLFAFKYTSENVSLFPALVNTFTMTITALLMAAPLGIFSGIYLVEYANRNSKSVKVIRITTETLSGIPSIVYGLFGYLLFVATLGWGYSMLAGSFSLAIMILPVIIRSTEESLKSVPDTYREGSFGLGAGKLRTVFKIVLPAAMPGILAGIILSIGRIVGETAVLIYTSGTVAQIPKNLMGSGRTLSVHLYALWSEGMNTDSAYATAVVLVVTVIFLNAMSAYVAKKFTKGKKNG